MKSVFQHLINHFEETVCPGKRITENERLFFLSGVSLVTFLLDLHVKEANKTGDLDKSLKVVQTLKYEALLFSKGPIAEYHKFFCDKCTEGEKHGDIT